MTETINGKSIVPIHNTTHEDGGSDEVSVAGLSGELADDQPPLDHVTDHETGGGDALSSLAGSVIDSSEVGRDFLPVKAIGSLYLSTPATEGMVAGTEEKVAGTTTAGPLQDFTMPVDNRLLYGGTDTIQVRVIINVAGSFSVNFTTLGIYVAKNGSFIPASHIDREVATGGDHGSWGTSWKVELATGDYIEAFLESDKTGDATIDHMVMTVTEL